MRADFIKLVGRVRDPFGAVALRCAVGRWGCQAAEFLSRAGRLRKIGKVSTTEKTFFFCLFTHNGRDSLVFSDQKVPVGILAFAFVPRDEK